MDPNAPPLLVKDISENARLAPIHAAASVSDRAVSVLWGDRSCASCGFNLVGQRIVREGVYGMLLVRCPECNTAASLQEYPLLGRWAARWGAVLAAGWLLGLLMWGVLNVWACFQLSHSAVVEASSTLAREAVVRQVAHSKIELEEIKKTDPEFKSRTAFSLNFMATQVAEAYGTLDLSWWNAQDADAMFQEVGGWRRGVNWGAAAVWVYGSVLGVGFGMVWAVALAHVRGWKLMAVPLVIAVFAVVMSLLPEARSLFYFDPFAQYNRGGGPWIVAIAAVRATIEPIMLPASVVFCGLCMGVGVWIGRPVARLAVRALLAPRMRGTLAFLWLCDGKEPPTAGPVYRAPGVLRR